MGVDPLALPLPRFCSLIHHIITRNMPAKDREAFLMDLNEQPKGAPKSSLVDPNRSRDTEMAMFQAAMAARQARTS